MLDEFKSIEYIINELNNQVGFFNENKDNAESLLQDVAKLKSKYDIPYLIYVTRNSDGIYNKEKSSLLENIAYTLNMHFKEKVGLEYSVNFLDVKRMIFTISKQDIEIVRFSLINKNYAFMNSIVQNEDEYLEGKKNVERNIENLNNDVLDDLAKLKIYENERSLYFKLFKEVKTVGDLYSLIFKYKTIKANLANSKINIEHKINSMNKIIDSEKERLLHLNDEYERSKPIVDDLTKFFASIDYHVDERHKFYN